MKVIGEIQLKTLALLQSKSDADIEEAVKKCIVKGIFKSCYPCKNQTNVE